MLKKARSKTLHIEILDKAKLPFIKSLILGLLTFYDFFLYIVMQYIILYLFG